MPHGFNSFLIPENVQLLPGTKLRPFRKHGSVAVWWVEEEYLPEGAEILETQALVGILDCDK